MFPGCSWVGWLLVLLWVAAGNRITRSGKKKKFARVRAGDQNKKEKLWKSESNAPVGETQQLFSVFQVE